MAAIVEGEEEEEAAAEALHFGDEEGSETLHVSRMDEHDAVEDEGAHEHDESAGGKQNHHLHDVALGVKAAPLRSWRRGDWDLRAHPADLCLICFFKAYSMMTTTCQTMMVMIMQTLEMSTLSLLPQMVELVLRLRRFKFLLLEALTTARVLVPKWRRALKPRTLMLPSLALPLMAHLFLGSLSFHLMLMSLILRPSLSPFHFVHSFLTRIPFI